MSFAFQILFLELSMPIWFATISLIGVFFAFFCTQSGLPTISLRGSFATFSPKLKIFWYTFAFLDFSVQIYFQQASWWDGFVGVLGVSRHQIRVVAKFRNSNTKHYVKA